MCTTENRRTSIGARRRGFSLIELLIFIVVVSVGVAGILKVMDVTVAASSDPMLRKQAVALADAVLEEVMLKAYNDPDGSAVGEVDRFSYDNVDDFNGKTNADFAPLPAELSAYVIGVAVTASALGTRSAKKVTVTVTRGSDVVTLIAYRTNY